jgi:hypothetical protein
VVLEYLQRALKTIFDSRTLVETYQNIS